MQMAFRYKDWRKKVENTPIGRIWLSNLDFDERSGNLTQPVLEEFRRGLDEHLRASNRRDGPIVTVERMLSSGAFYFKGKRKPPGSLNSGRVIDAATFGRCLVPKRMLQLGYETDEGDGERVWNLLGDKIKPEHYDGIVSSFSNPFLFWCTPTRDIQDFLDRANAKASQGRADALRNVLGLDKIGEGVYLLCINFSDHKLSSKRFVAPTTLDAGAANVLFSPCTEEDGFGRTLELNTLVDGLRELIVEPIDFCPEFSVTKIDKTATNPPDCKQPEYLERLYYRSRNRESNSAK